MPFSQVSPVLECAQCLELFRARASMLGTGNEGFTRAFFCGPQCYKAVWESHRANHAASTAGPSRTDARTHEFEAAKGFGALWDSRRLKRTDFEGCMPEIPEQPPAVDDDEC